VTLSLEDLAMTLLTVVLVVALVRRADRTDTRN